MLPDMASLIAMFPAGDDSTDATRRAVLNDAVEHAQMDAPVVKMPDLSPDVLALVKEAWDKDGEERKVEEQARTEADANGTVSAYDVPIVERGHGHAHRKTTRRRLLDQYLAQSEQDAITHQRTHRQGDLVNNLAADDDVLNLAALAANVQRLLLVRRRPDLLLRRHLPHLHHPSARSRRVTPHRSSCQGHLREDCRSPTVSATSTTSRSRHEQE